MDIERLRECSWTGPSIDTLEELDAMDPGTGKNLKQFYTEDKEVIVSVKTQLQSSEYSAYVSFTEPSVRLFPSNEEVTITQAATFEGLTTSMEVTHEGTVTEAADPGRLIGLLARAYCATPFAVGDRKTFSMGFRFLHAFTDKRLEEAMHAKNYRGVYESQRRHLIRTKFWGYSSYSRCAEIDNHSLRQAVRTTGYAVPTSLSAKEQCQTFGLCLFNDHRYPNTVLRNITHSSGLSSVLELNALDILNAL